MSSSYDTLYVSYKYCRNPKHSMCIKTMVIIYFCLHGYLKHKKYILKQILYLQPKSKMLEFLGLNS